MSLNNHEKIKQILPGESSNASLLEEKKLIKTLKAHGKHVFR